MSTVSGVASVDTSSAYSNYKSSSAKSYLDSVKSDTSSAETAAAVYEKSEETEGVTAKKKYTPNQALVEKLKSEAEQRTAQLQSIVSQLITGQGNAYGQANDIWSLFANGDFSNVSEAAKAQAKEDIAEGGYWSVDETANRIVDFAKALTGGDPDKIDSMIDAFKKGYEQATKSWGQDLPEISSKTYDAVLSGFEDWRNEA